MIHYHPYLGLMGSILVLGLSTHAASSQLVQVAPSRDAALVYSEMINRGKAAFRDRCTQCHDAARALDKQKSLAEWQKTVGRMARKRSADIPDADRGPISAYLDSLGNTPIDTSSGKEQMSGPVIEETQPPTPGPNSNSFLDGQFDFGATISTVFRDSTKSNGDLENGGFTPDIWVRAEWHSDRNPVRVRVQSCVTCHTEGRMNDRIALVEAVSVFDVLHDKETNGIKAEVQAGRFLVPFGGHANNVHPAAMHFVTRPLMFNMGHNVNRVDIGGPVLPMPYSDEGAMTNLVMPFPGNRDVTASVDAYVVNGLQSAGAGLDTFWDSRDYTDNNSKPAYGGRVTVGNRHVRLGASYMGGQFNDTAAGGVTNQGMDYTIVGADVTVRFRDIVRFQAEIAQRKSDRFFFPDVVEDEIQGISFEGHVRILQDPQTSFVGRYEMMDTKGNQPPPGSSLTVNEFTVDRITWGLNIGLPGGSTLLLNHEHWIMPEGLGDVDVIGARWTVPF